MPVARLEAQIVQRRTIHAGESCGYGGTFRAERDTEAAVVNIGYADGYWRGFSSVGSGEALGAKLPVLGRVSMDLIVLGCDEVPSLAAGDWIDIDFNLEDASKRSGMSQYELLTGLGLRFERIWHEVAGAGVFGRKRQRSLTGQCQHSGLRALQMYRPCRMSQ
jgi:alanine racemase